jgi:hypothetical protein
MKRDFAPRIASKLPRVADCLANVFALDEACAKELRTFGAIRVAEGQPKGRHAQLPFGECKMSLTTCS